MDIDALRAKLDTVAGSNPTLAKNLRGCLAAAEELPEDRDLAFVMQSVEFHADAALSGQAGAEDIRQVRRNRRIVLALLLAALVAAAIYAAA